MAIYSYHKKIKCRTRGDSVEATGAYITGSSMTDALTGKKYSYETKDDVDFVFVLSPKGVPERLKIPEVLCQEITRREKRKDSQLCRYIIAAIPKELPKNKIIEMTKSFCFLAFVSRGMIVLAAIHGIEGDNPHLHIIVTMRQFDLVMGEFGLKDRSWNAKSLLKKQRKEWEVSCNDALVQIGRPDIKISCESYEKQGIKKPKQKHMGTYAHKLWKEKDIITERNAQYVIDSESKKLEEIEREILEVELEITSLSSPAPVDSVQIDFVPQLKNSIAPQLVPSSAQLGSHQALNDEYSGPTFDLSRIFVRAFEPETNKPKQKYVHNFDEDMNLETSVEIVCVGNPSVAPVMTLKQRIQMYINNHWDLKQILPKDLLVELGLYPVAKEIIYIRVENRGLAEFSYSIVEDDVFPEDSESNLIKDKNGKLWLASDYYDPYRDYDPEDDLDHLAAVSQDSGPGLGS